MKVGRGSFRPKWWMRRNARQEDEKQDPTHKPDLEPMHDEPWIPDNALADRVRRSPRE
jgi:hypothetical protein